MRGSEVDPIGVHRRTIGALAPPVPTFDKRVCIKYNLH